MSSVEVVKGLLLESGSVWVLWLLGLLSLASFAVIVERALFYRTLGDDLRGLSLLLDRRLSKDEIAGALDDLSGRHTVAASIASAGIRLSHLGPAAADKAMQSAVALERTRLDRGLAFLGTLGNNAPFIGLFGTVIGVIGAFEHLGEGHAEEGAKMASHLASQAVMGSIAEALVATAVGILVALPAVAANNYFQRKVVGLLSGTDVVSNLVLAYLSAEKS